MSGFALDSDKGKSWDLRINTSQETHPKPQVHTTFVRGDDGRGRKVKEAHVEGNRLRVEKHFEGPPGEERLVLMREELTSRGWRGDTLHFYTFFEGEAGHEQGRADLLVPEPPEVGCPRLRVVYEDSAASMSSALESVHADVEAGRCNEQTYSNYAKVLKHHHEWYESKRDHVADE